MSPLKMDAGSAFIIGLTTGIIGSVGVFLYLVSRNRQAAKGKTEQNENEQVQGKVLFLNIIILDGKKEVVEKVATEK